ncbi:transposase [Pseudomonas sp. MPR-R2A5]|uniref:transposase n=1 Tax=unclassified Pseudomonas TaxID=196821 RepID=UPI0034D21D0A
MLNSLAQQYAHHLRNQFGVDPQSAATLISGAGDNPERLKSEPALAALCGVSPLPASSGKTVRHRLNRGGVDPPTIRCGRSSWGVCAVIHKPGPT